LEKRAILVDEKKLRHTARGAAISALLTVQENEGYSNIVIDKAIRRFALSPADSALSSAIFYGVLEKKLTLDFYIEASLKNPGKKLEIVVQMILRAAVFQIYFLDRIPDNAIVNEAVEAVKEFGMPGFSGLVNAVLRGILRKRGELHLPNGDDAQSLSIRYSIPVELIQLWERSYGNAVMLQILEAFSKQPAVYARVNTIKISRDDFIREELLPGTRTCEGFEAAATLTAGGNLTRTEPFLNGLFHIQDLSAQLICEVVSPKPHERILDCCAAPGGKAFTMAEMMENTGEIDAFDLYKGRVRLVRDGARRLSISNIRCSMRDMTKPFDADLLYDKVLCDVPCSGYGVIARKPEIRYKPLKEQRTLSRLQYGILSNAAKHVKKGGQIIYSTCTLNPEENTAVAKAFLQSHSDFTPAGVSLPVKLRRSIEEDAHMLTVMPYMMESDGFFAAAFQRL